MTEEINPCSFCSNSKPVEDVYGTYSKVSCDDCGTQGPAGLGAAAVQGWNRLHPVLTALDIAWEAVKPENIEGYIYLTKEDCNSVQEGDEYLDSITEGRQWRIACPGSYYSLIRRKEQENLKCPECNYGVFRDDEGKRRCNACGFRASLKYILQQNKESSDEMPTN